MALKLSHTLLLVDDEVSITKSLQRLFRKEGYGILTASSGQEAIDLLKKVEKEVSLIISDQRMPGMNGAEFLEQAKKIFPNAMRFLLTGYSDMDAIIEAVNKGEIHRYLNKPWNDKDLLLQVHNALEHYELRFENKRLMNLTAEQQSENERLGEGLVESMRLLTSLVERLNPVLDKYMAETAILAKEVASAYNLSKEELNQIEIAAMVHDIGLLELPKGLILKSEEDMTPDEFAKYKQHPAIAQVCIQSVDGFEQASEIILNHHEHYDGRGFPRGMQGDEIPLGSRILSVVSDYSRVLYTWPRDINEIAKKARDYFGSAAKEMIVEDPKQLLAQVAKKIMLLRSGQKYDIEVVSTMIKILGEKEREEAEKVKHVVQIELENLRTGMTLGKNLRTQEGRVLLRKGTAIKEKNVDTIRELAGRGVISDKIYISISSEQASKLRELRLKKMQEQEKVSSVPLENLREGMALAKNVRTLDGRLLFSKGAKLNAPSIKKIQELVNRGNLKNEIYVMM